MPEEPDEHTEQSPEEFEELVAAALKVDPKGLSGKHRNPPPSHEEGETEGRD